MAMAMRARRRRTDEGPKPGFVMAAEPSPPAQVVSDASSPDTPAATSDIPATTTAEPQTTATQTVPATTDDDTATAQSPPASS
jgi:hypothetical protein